MASETVGGTPLVVYVDQHRKVEGGTAVPVYITNLDSGGGGGASDVDGLTTTTGNEGEMLRVAAAGGLEYRTPAEILEDIGGLTAAEREWLSAALAAQPDPEMLGVIPNPDGAYYGQVWTANEEGDNPFWGYVSLDVEELTTEDGTTGDVLRVSAGGGVEYHPLNVTDLNTTGGNYNDMVRVGPSGGLQYRTPTQVAASLQTPNPADAPSGTTSIWTAYGYGTAGWTNQIQFLESILNDYDITSGNTRLMLWDVDAAALVRVSVGADDSGGTGYKVLRIPN